MDCVGHWGGRHARAGKNLLQCCSAYSGRHELEARANVPAR